MKFNLKNRPKMMTGNMDRTLFLGKEVEEWFLGFEKELRAILKQGIFDEADNYCTVKLLLEILGDSP